MRAAVDYDIDISELGWFFTPAYQSTDESDTTPVLDPNTDIDEGDEILVSSTLKPWITRPPLYRTAEVSIMCQQLGPYICSTFPLQFDEWVLELDGKVMDSRRQYEKDHKGKTGPHARRRGRPVDAALPKLKKKNEKIPRYAIDKFWLQNHPECDKPTRIEDWGEEVQDNVELDGERGYSPEQSGDEEDQLDSGDELYS